MEGSVLSDMFEGDLYIKEMYKDVYEMSDDELYSHFLYSSLGLNRFLGLFPAENGTVTEFTQEEKDEAWRMVREFRSKGSVKSELDDICSCGNCGGTPSFSYHTNRGHGDIGFEDLRLKCDCGISIGDVNNYGEPTFEDRNSVIKLWNKINSK